MSEPVTSLQPDDLPAAIAATSRAFWPDPLFGFFSRDDLQQHLMLPHFMGAMMKDALAHGEVGVVRQGNRIAGTVSWVPPDGMPQSTSRQLRIAAATARSLLVGRNRIMGLRLLDKMQKAHPHEPHWYLALLGVDPAFQGRGFGGDLLRPKLALCDEQGLPVFLETQKPENLPFYGRFGFRVLDEISVSGSPTIWQMWRDPQST
jgi:ribosomal protein S18 acetylase RimI-like enzyme